jgi:hypothetical protein
VNPLDLTAVPHPRFPVQGHMLSTAADALREELMPRFECKLR